MTQPSKTELNEFRDKVRAFAEAHEKADHNGVTCWTERCDLAAWIIHSLGLDSDPEVLREMLVYVQNYRDNCPDTGAAGAEHSH